MGWCKQEVGNNVFNPEAPRHADLGDALNQTLDWGEEIGSQVWETGQMCIHGEPWYMGSQNASGSLEQLDCMYQDPQTGTTHTFACASADTALLGIWGCLDTDLNIYATQLAVQAGPGVTTNSGQQLNPHALMSDPAGEFAVHNIRPQHLFAGMGPPVGYLWMLTVEQCDDGNTTPGDGCSSYCAKDDGGGEPPRTGARGAVTATPA